MKRFFSKMNVRMAISFFVISVALAGSISLIAYFNASDIILGNIKRQTDRSVAQASEYIASYLDKIKGLSDLISMHADTVNALSKSQKQSLESVAAMVKISAQLDPRIQSIAVVSKNGFAITGESDMAISLSDNMMEQSWYQMAIASDQMPAITSVRHGEFTMDKSSWVISISREITDEQNTHLGVVLIDISYRFIEDYISDLNLGKSGFAFILDGNNRIIYHKDESVLMDEMKAEQLRMISNLTEKAQLSKKSELSGDQEFIITKSPISNSNWLLVGISSMEEMQELREGLIAAILWIDILLLFFSIIISYAVSKFFTDPIVALQNAMMKVDEDWRHIRINPGSSLEIKTLSQEYNALIDRIRMLTEDIAQKEDAKRVFELKALQSQINPHFLYNTLDTILWLAEFGESEKVIDVSKALGKMLRYSLNIHRTMVNLQDEIEHAQNYLKIQSYRYEDKIRYEIQGDQSLLSLQVPKLILQPIVENAIYHGIRQKQGVGKIQISYAVQEDHLLMEVRDDGVGYGQREDDEETFGHERIKAKLGGIGMANVDQRIKILCGQEYGIEIRRLEEGGSLVRYRLKRIESEM